MTPEQARAVREQAGVTQQQAAEACGVSRVAFNRWETGKTTPHKVFQKLWDEFLEQCMAHAS